MPRRVRSIDEADRLQAGAVDVDDLLNRLSVEELARSADDYYLNNRGGGEYYFAKPFGNPSETPDYLITFGQVLSALELAPGMRVLDFGAGTGWTSRYLSQLGCEVVVSDVSETALELARELYERQPLVGDRPAPTFQRFDGKRIDLPDASVDRVLCFDAFHHTPNPCHVLGELGRVLRPGGRAAFSEPGPNHSKTAQSQFEMKNYVVIENDIRMRAIRDWAQAAGFDQLRLAAFTTQPFHLSIEGYERLLAGRQEARDLLSHQRPFLETHRVFWLHREGDERRDSRQREGLGGVLAVHLDDGRVDGEPVRGSFEVANTGRNHWLPGDAAHGAVRIGVHLYDEEGWPLDRDYARIDLLEPQGLAPGGRAVGRFEMPAPKVRPCQVEFDLVAESVAWFEITGTAVVRHSLN